MKYLPSQILFFFSNTTFKKNKGILIKFLIAIVVIITLYSIIFHFIMEYEGREYSWITGFYWTLTVMSTLGFGDITFSSDFGLIFSMFVLLSGIITLLIMLPFTFIRFFYAPWLEAQAQARTPRELPETTRGHVIITNYEPITMSLIKKLDQYSIEYVIVVNDMQSAAELLDANYKVFVGALDEPETYSKLRVARAALIFVNNNDMLNTNIIATIRQVSESVPIITTAEEIDSIDILELAGATQVMQFTKMLGITMAQHTLGVSSRANIVENFGNALIAEAYAAHTPYEGKTLIESGLRESTGVNVVGIWERGRFEIPRPQTLINSASILLLAGSEEHFRKYDEFIGRARTFAAPVVILGGGRVGHAAAAFLDEHRIDYRIVEKNKNLILEDDKKYILGNAADIKALERAGVSREAPAVLITTHDDDINIYLTIYCRKLRPNIQIISRAILDRNISKLYSVGADIVLSYASMGANRILNILKPDEVLMLAEGLNIFNAPVPPSLAGKTLAENQIRKKTGCNVIAIHSGEDFHVNPAPSATLHEHDELLLIGTAEAEKEFMDAFSS